MNLPSYSYYLLYATSFKSRSNRMLW